MSLKAEGNGAMNECCGMCRYHVPGEIPGEGDWICNNGDAEDYGVETPYAYCCADFEEK